MLKTISVIELSGILYIRKDSCLRFKNPTPIVIYCFIDRDTCLQVLLLLIIIMVFS